MPTFYLAQDCDCESTFAWVKKTFEQNDAGFSYVIETKGNNAYLKHTEFIQEKVKTEEASICALAIREWLDFFRDGHLDFQWVGEDGSKGKEEVPENWEVLDFNQSDFQAKNGTASDAGFEGLWKPLNKWDNDIQSLGVKKYGNTLKGFVVESSDPVWGKGQLKFSIHKKEGKLRGTYFFPNRSEKHVTDIELLGEDYLQLGDILFQRVKQATRGETEKIQKYVNSFLSEEPKLTQLDESTILIRIPSFSLSQKKLLDQLLEENHEKLTSIDNLILDLRNNGGGGDDSYDELLPYIYTNPIRVVGVEFLSTTLNNVQMEAYANNPDLDDETREYVQAIYKKLLENMGDFVNIYEDIVELEELETAHKNPQEVAIIIDQECGSTTEQFLLAAKQSKKVKLYGRTTFGALDISNMNVVESPCKKFVLGYAMSRSMRIPGMAIDGKGIQPDYYIDSSIPKYKWVDFVRETMNQ